MGSACTFFVREQNPYQSPHVSRQVMFGFQMPEDAVLVTEGVTSKPGLLAAFALAAGAVGLSVLGTWFFVKEGLLGWLIGPLIGGLGLALCFWSLQVLALAVATKHYVSADQRCVIGIRPVPMSLGVATVTVIDLDAVTHVVVTLSDRKPSLIEAKMMTSPAGLALIDEHGDMMYHIGLRNDALAEAKQRDLIRALEQVEAMLLRDVGEQSSLLPVAGAASSMSRDDAAGGYQPPVLPPTVEV